MRRIVGTIVFVGAILLTSNWVSSSPHQAKEKNAKGSAAKAATYGYTDMISEEELKIYDYFLSADQLEGRNLPSRGYDTAALYIAGHMREWNLKPGGSSTGTDGPLQPYIMPFELVSNQLDAAGMKLALTTPAPAARGGRGSAAGGGPGGRGEAPAAAPVTHSYEYAKEWTIGGGAGGFGGGGRGGGAPQAADMANAPMVFVGNGYLINKSNTNPYQGVDVRGKIMVVAGIPQELATAQQAALAARGAGAGGRGAAAGGRGGAPANPLGVENTDFTTPQTYAVKNGALGIVMVPTFQQMSSMALPSPGGGGRGGGLNGPSYQVVKFQTARPASVPTIMAGLELTNALFQGEKLNAAQVFDGATANAKLESFALSAEKKMSLHVAVNSDFNHAENVIAMIEGGDPVLKNEYVVMSAHLDHIGLANPNSTGDNVNNGADDDASGCAALMGIARAFEQGAEKGVRLKRTIIFLWVAGEEKGLWGSQYFNQFPPIDITKVVLDLNIDMIGRSKTPGYVDPPAYKLAERNEVFVVGPNISSDDLNKTLETVNAGYLKLNLNHFYDVTAPDATHDNLGPGTTGQRIFSRSDHYNFAKMGIPVAFFTTGLHSDYHQVTDSPDKIDFKQMLAITKTMAAVAWVVGNTSTPPKINAKMPERLVNDMKNVQEQGWGKLTPVLAPLAKNPH